ncbi:ParA family protein [Streptomyces sp. NPDC046374]|uniref:ParA family protein n=1 Tax=Streptomyces sp. NPDC046374 TaxID=3154917 RepID=UPI0033CAA153
MDAQPSKTTYIVNSAIDVAAAAAGTHKPGPRIYLVVSRKGGVGKSTFVAQLSAVVADTLGPDPVTGEPVVAAISADPQGSLKWWMQNIENGNPDGAPFFYIQLTEDGDLEDLSRLRELPFRHIFVDTPGWQDIKEDTKLLGDSREAKIMRILLAQADGVIVPVEVEPMSWEPTTSTIEHVIKPSGVPYVCVVNNWEPRDGGVEKNPDRDNCIDFIDGMGWNRAHNTVRHYRVHAQAPLNGLVCTQYRQNRMELNAGLDFYRLAVELGLGKAQPRVEMITSRLEGAEQ